MIAGTIVERQSIIPLNQIHINDMRTLPGILISFLFSKGAYPSQQLLSYDH